jgi:predicted GNAT family acetyltransferase
MKDTPEEVSVTNNEAARRYEAYVGDQVAFIAYQRLGDRITFIHTEVPKALEGHGIAGKMARVALDEARANHLAVIPRCPFVADYIRRHPEYAELVPPDDRARLLTHQS